MFWRRWLLWKCRVWVFAGAEALIIFYIYFLSLGSVGHSRYVEYQKKVLWSIYLLLPNILLIDMTLWCWLRSVQKRMNKKCHSLNWNKWEAQQSPQFDKGVGFTCEMPWLHFLCVPKMWKLCAQQHCPMWSANVYLFTVGRKFHKCMKCSLHMYPTSPSMSPKREIIYLSVYHFKDSKTSSEERKLALGSSK